MKMKKFASQVEYEAWIETFEECSEYQDIPVLIDEGWKISADMFTECKSYKTALRRFEKTFSSVPEIAEWIEGIRESCENGCFEDTTGWKPAWTNDPEEIKEFAKSGTYSWGVEETSEGCWYIFLNISGKYADCEADMRYNTVKTTEMWAKIQAMGEFERDFRNGELWYFNGEYWYLSHLELPPEELREVTEFYSGAEAI